ncbi:latent nuclear antigen, putative [Perkinsus marinus ATCC 50983]|uniref:Latent nuclear antigen, putative n=1 Tax=Perkinsus marinus (strain ATCC 50983 / TXsc) TaxID=423536 RepID=C5KC03_PERM5|nr:latent nuclear antigen, putative [Perkinsus marinus ATCC 50983]EER18034.1 latent nuclear antigen, putative [Perkinsus marinus ATCC 50983]|eukprot:XP_002786238.1 latent nuclear antigen, putative [Perkinsus marinus ATCC 50983]
MGRDMLFLCGYSPLRTSQDASSSKEKYEESLARVSHLLNDDDMVEEENRERGPQEEEGDGELRGEAGEQDEAEHVTEKDSDDQDVDEEEDENSFVEIARKREKRTAISDDEDEEEDEDEESFVQEGNKGGKKTVSSLLEQKVAKRKLVRN